MGKFKDISVDNLPQYHSMSDVEQLHNKISLRAHSVMLDVCVTLEQSVGNKGKLLCRPLFNLALSNKNYSI